MSTTIDCTDPQQVFNRLAQLQHETRIRLDQIEFIHQQQNKASNEFVYLEPILDAYLRKVKYPAVLGVAYENIGTSLRKSHEYAISIEGGQATATPVIAAFKIPSLTPEQVENATKLPPVLPPMTRTQEAEAAALEAMLDSFETPDPDPEIINKALESTWNLDKISCNPEVD